MSKKPGSKEFRDDVVRVVRSRVPVVWLDQIAKDFGIHFAMLCDWLRKAGAADGERPGMRRGVSAEPCEAKRWIRPLGQENGVLCRAAAYLSQTNLPGK